MSAVIHPYYGEVYSFPWKRGPHTAVLEYNDNYGNFDILKDTVYSALSEFNWTNKLTYCFKELYESDNVTCIAIYRIFLQLLRFKLDLTTLITSDSGVMKLLHASLNGSNIVLKSLSLEIFKILISQLEV